MDGDLKVEANVKALQTCILLVVSRWRLLWLKKEVRFYRNPPCDFSRYFPGELIVTTATYKTHWTQQSLFSKLCSRLQWERRTKQKEMATLWSIIRLFAYHIRFQNISEKCSDWGFTTGLANHHHSGSVTLLYTVYKVRIVVPQWGFKAFKAPLRSDYSS